MPTSAVHVMKTHLLLLLAVPLALQTGCGSSSSSTRTYRASPAVDSLMMALLMQAATQMQANDFPSETTHLFLRSREDQGTNGVMYQYGFKNLPVEGAAWLTAFRYTSNETLEQTVAKTLSGLRQLRTHERVEQVGAPDTLHVPVVRKDGSQGSPLEIVRARYTATRQGQNMASVMYLQPAAVGQTWRKIRVTYAPELFEQDTIDAIAAELLVRE